MPYKKINNNLYELDGARDLRRQYKNIVFSIKSFKHEICSSNNGITFHKNVFIAYDLPSSGFLKYINSLIITTKNELSVYSLRSLGNLIKYDCNHLELKSKIKEIFGERDFKNIHQEECLTETLNINDLYRFINWAEKNEYETIDLDDKPTGEIYLVNRLDNLISMRNSYIILDGSLPELYYIDTNGNAEIKESDKIELSHRITKLKHIKLDGKPFHLNKNLDKSVIDEWRTWIEYFSSPFFQPLKRDYIDNESWKTRECLKGTSIIKNRNIRVVNTKTSDEQYFIKGLTKVEIEIYKLINNDDMIFRHECDRLYLGLTKDEEDNPYHYNSSNVINRPLRLLLSVPEKQFEIMKNRKVEIEAKINIFSGLFDPVDCNDLIFFEDDDGLFKDRNYVATIQHITVSKKEKKRKKTSRKNTQNNTNTNGNKLLTIFTNISERLLLINQSTGTIIIILVIFLLYVVFFKN